MTITAHVALARYVEAPATMLDALPIPLRLSRVQFPAILRRIGARRLCEVGVWKGAFSAHLAASVPGASLLAVDPWQSYPAWQDTKNSLPPAEQQAFMAGAHAEAVTRLGRYPNVTICRKFSTDAARDVADGSLDFVYIDANHVKAAVLEDLAAWVPKVRPGGIVAGHDYRAFSNKPTIEVIEAVQTYTQAAGIRPWFITARDKTPSWVWVC